MPQQPLKTHKNSQRNRPDAPRFHDEYKNTSFIHHRAHKTPRLPRVRPSCLIKCVTLKRTETHAVASGTKPGLFTYCVTMLMRGWEASQQAGRHHCPTVWSGGAQTPLRLPLPHPSTSLTSLLHAQLIQCCLHNSTSILHQ